MLTLHHDRFFLSINTHMQVYPLWVIKGYLRGCVTSLFVYTMLSKETSWVSKPLWHTNYCCVDVFFPHRQCGRVPEQQHYSHNVTKICFYLEMTFASSRWSSGPKHMHVRAHTVSFNLFFFFYIFFIFHLEWNKSVSFQRNFFLVSINTNVTPCFSFNAQLSNTGN